LGGLAAEKWVATAQHGVLHAAKLTVLSFANSSSSGTCCIAKVNAKVTNRVICVFHAPFTPALEKAIEAL